MKSRRRTDTDGGFFAGRFMTEKRKAHRVVFEKGFTANMMAIDGTWRRPCTMLDASATGARLAIDGSMEGLTLKEFFLVLSTVGKASGAANSRGSMAMKPESILSRPVERKENQNSAQPAVG